MRERLEKEEAFSAKWNNGTASKNIWDYIPVSKSVAVIEAYTDLDGYWVMLADEFTAYDGAGDCGTIHEYTVSDLRNAIKTIRRKKRGE